MSSNTDGFIAGKTLINNVNLFTLAVSIGAVDSLIQHPRRSMTHASVLEETCLEGGITNGLVKISIGLEDIDDLIEDLSSALSKIAWKISLESESNSFN
jgi:methionine-gamma-lyase